MKRATSLFTLAALCGTVLAAAATHAAPAAGSSAAERALGAPVGVFAAYHGTVVTKNTTATVPANRPVSYHGPKLVLAQSYVGRKAAEPTLGVDRSGTIFTVASAFDAIPGNPPKNEPKTLVERSTDGGRTFTAISPTAAGVAGTHPNSLDPYIYVDPKLGRVFDIDLELAGSVISYSDDKGKTWTSSALTSAFGANDHQTLVSGVVPEGSPLSTLDPAYPRIVYYCVNQIDAGACARSLDGGRTFLQANQTGYTTASPTSPQLVCGELHGHAVTDRQGRLFIPRGYCQQPYIAISSDAGTTFHDVLVTDKVGVSGQQSSVAVDGSGNLYYTWQDNLHQLPYLSVSRDHGETWSAPLMIAPPGVHETNFPTIDVGDPGKIAIMFPGTTAVGANPNVPDNKDKTRPWNSYVVMSTDALSAHPLFLSNISNPRYDPVARGDCNGRCGRMYDFLDIVSAPGDQGRVFASAVDTCTAYLSCNSKRLPGNNDSGDIVQEETAHDYGVSADMQEVILREVSGPALRGPAKFITHDSPRRS
ncbi:MAG: glycoside hydrolase [Actinomycetota bacterium]|nr:glycoside hydrolase [Actinomycetota bacterium]